MTSRHQNILPSRKSYNFILSSSPFQAKSSLRQTIFPPAEELSTTFPCRYTRNSIGVYFFRYSKAQVGKSKEFNNQGINKQVNRSFKSYSFFVTKNNKKAGRLYMKFSLTPKAGVQQMPSIPFIKSTFSYFVNDPVWNNTSKYYKTFNLSSFTHTRVSKATLSHRFFLLPQAKKNY